MNFSKYWVLSIHQVSYSILYLDTWIFPNFQVKYRVGYLEKFKYWCMVCYKKLFVCYKIEQKIQKLLKLLFDCFNVWPSAIVVYFKDRRYLEKSRNFRDFTRSCIDSFFETKKFFSRWPRDLWDQTKQDLVFYENLRDCLRDFSRYTRVLHYLINDGNSWIFT